MQDRRHGRLGLPVAGRRAGLGVELDGRDVDSVLVDVAKQGRLEVIQEGLHEALVARAALKVVRRGVREGDGLRLPPNAFFQEPVAKCF